MNIQTGKSKWGVGWVGALLVWAVASVSAQSTWVPQTGTTNWNTSANWSPAGVPSSGAGTALVFTNAAAGAAYTASNDLSGTFLLNQLNFTNANGSGGTITVSGSALAFTNNAATLPTLTQGGAGAVSINNAVTFATNTTFAGSGAGVVTFAGTPTLAAKSSLTLSGPAVTFTTSGNLTLAQGAGQAIQLNAGTLTLSATTTGSSFTSNNLVAAGGTLSYSGTYIGRDQITLNADLVVSACPTFLGFRVTGAADKTLTVRNGAGNTTFSFSSSTWTNFSGTLVLDQPASSGGGLFLFNGGNAAVDMSGHKLALTNYATVAETTTANLFKFGELSGGANTQVGGSGGNVAMALQIGALNTTSTFAGKIVDNAGAGNVTTLTKVGTGALTLAGTNTYSGTTTVSNGALLVTGALGTNGVSVLAGATLGGSGRIGGLITVASNGTLLVGTATNAPAALSISNSVTFLAGAKLTLALTNTTVGSGYSQLALANGGLTLGAGQVTLNVQDAGFAASAGSQFLVVTGFTNSVDGLNQYFLAADGVTALSNGVTFTSSANAGNTYSIGYEAGAITLTAVPEPAVLSLLALLGAGGLLARRRTRPLG